MAKFRGAGAREQWASMLQGGGMRLCTDEGRSVFVAARYVHLGSAVDPCLNPLPDVKRKCSEARAATRDLRKLLSSPRVAAKVKLQLTGSLVYSRLMRQMELWPAL